MMATPTGCGIKLVVAKGIKGDGVIWRGEWSASEVYDYIDAVSRGGSAWISKRNQNIGHDPLTDDGTWWDCMVESPLHGDEAHTEDYVKEGDFRLTNPRTPTIHGDEAHTEVYIKEGDPRLTNARMPIEHASTHTDGTDNIQLATSEQKGLMSDVYAAKLDGIEENANNYVHPATHSLDMITETDVLKIFTADERDRLSTLGGIPI